MAELRALRIRMERAATPELVRREAELNQRTEDLSHSDVSSAAVADAALAARHETMRATIEMRMSPMSSARPRA